VRIHGISIRNPHNAPNTDGINPDSCQFVRISDCYLNVGDDCITLKSGEEDVDRPPERASCENITITNCTMVRGHGAVVCGSEMSGNVRNVTISNCVFRGTDRGLRFKSRRGRGGIIENVRMTNIVMEDVRTPLCGNLFYHCEAYGEARVTDTHAYPLDDTTPRMERLHFSHITARNAWHAAGVFHGLPEMSIRDLVMEDIDIQMAPDAKEGWTIMASTIPKLARRAFVFRHVDGLRMRDVRVDGHEGPFLDQEKCENLKVDEGA
jgi:polygalacturonase